MELDKKLEKPHFRFSIIDKAGALFGIILPIITYWISTWYLAIAVFLIILCILLIYNIFDYLKQVKALYEDYAKTLSNRAAIIKDFDKKVDTIKKQEKLLCEYNFILENTIRSFALSLTDVNEQEKKYLRQMYNISLINREHLLKLEEDLRNGRRL